MADKYFTDFGDGYTLGDITSQGWTSRYVTATTRHIIEDEDAGNGRALSINRSGANRMLLSWDAIDADADRSDFEIVCRMRNWGTSSVRGGPFGRGANTSTSADGYLGSINQASNGVRIGRYSGGTSTELDALVTESITPGTYFLIRFQCRTVSGEARLKVKLWLGEVGDEPEEWTLELSDTSPVTAAGWVGIFVFTGQTDIDWIGVGTGAFDAPTSATETPEGETIITSVTPTHDGATVTFSYDDTDADGFEWSIDGSVWTDVGDPDPPEFVASGLAERTDYAMRLRPYNGDGAGAEAEIVYFRTLPDVPLYDRQSVSVTEPGPVEGDAITPSVPDVRTYAIYRYPGGAYSPTALHEDWEAADGYAEDLAPGSASGIGSDLSVSYGYIAQFVAGEASGIGVDLTLTSGAVVPYTEAVNPGSSLGVGVDLTLTAGAVIDYGVDLIPGSASGLGVNLTLVSGDVVPYQVAIDAGLSDGLGVDLSLSAGYRSAVEVGQAQSAGVDASLIQGLSVDVDPGHADGLGVNLSLIAGEVQPYAPQITAGQAAGSGVSLALSAGYVPQIEAGKASGIGIALSLTQGYVSSVIAGAAHGLGVELSIFTGNILGTIRRPSTRDVLSTLSTRPA